MKVEYELYAGQGPGLLLGSQDQANIIGEILKKFLTRYLPIIFS